MNGMAASYKIFKLLDLPENRQDNKLNIGNDSGIICRNLRFSYEKTVKYSTVLI